MVDQNRPVRISNICPQPYGSDVPAFLINFIMYAISDEKNCDCGQQNKINDFLIQLYDIIALNNKLILLKVVELCMHIFNTQSSRMYLRRTRASQHNVLLIIYTISVHSKKQCFMLEKHFCRVGRANMHEAKQSLNVIMKRPVHSKVFDLTCLRSRCVLSCRLESG